MLNLSLAQVYRNFSLASPSRAQSHSTVNSEMMRNVRARMLRGASTPCKPLQFSARRAAFLTGRVVVAGQVRSQPRSRPSRLDVHNFKFLKDLGLKKPGFLPDFGLVRRTRIHSAQLISTTTRLLQARLKLVLLRRISGKLFWTNSIQVLTLTRSTT